ncbi:MAG TPA: RNA 2',3'-cyclic phosphodiesterase [Thermohalobaculum sp.]|nr:RNA 2',3'-cyclic phosphodiesterase [Thermohalobaculum sp.]
MIRAFVGIPLPGTVVSALGAAQAGLPAGRPVPPENFHLTVAFLGEHPEPLVEDVHLALDSIRAPRFALTLDGLGLFGGERPRVLHAEVRPEPMLAHLREKVLQAARGAGLRMDRARYNPHVTLARFRNGLKGEDAEKMRDFAVRRMAFKAGPFEVDEFVLYRSSLGRNGPVYHELAAYRLNGRDGA